MAEGEREGENEGENKREVDRHRGFSLLSLFSRFSFLFTPHS
jgi:hypothetical protein